MPKFRIVIPANSKECRHKDVMSVPSVETASYRGMENILSFFRHLGAYVEMYNPALEMWVEVTKEIDHVCQPTTTA